MWVEVETQAGVTMHTQAPKIRVATRGVPGTGFWNGANNLKQYFVLPKNGLKYYLKYTFLAFPVLGILGLGKTLVATYS